MRYAISDWEAEDMADLTSNLNTAIPTSAGDERTRPNWQGETSLILALSPGRENVQKGHSEVRTYQRIGTGGNKQIIHQQDALDLCVRGNGQKSMLLQVIGYRVFYIVLFCL